MASLTSSPDETWLPAGQPLIYTIGTQTTPLPSAFRYIIQVDENGVEIAKLYLAPNTNEVSHFDLSEVVRGRVNVDSKKFGTNGAIHSLNNKIYTKANEGVKLYTVKVGEWNGSTESLDEDSRNIWLIDGYFQVSDGLLPSFAAYYGTGTTRKFWLTDRVPENNVIELNADIDETGVVAFLNTDDTGSSVTNLRIYVYNTSGVIVGTYTDYATDSNNGTYQANSTFTNPTYVPGSLTYAYIYPSSYTPLKNSLTAVSGGWGYYEVRPTNAAGVEYANKLRIYNKCFTSKNESVRIAWANTVGGWDYLRFNGRKKKTVTREEKTYRKLLGDYSAATYSFGTSDRQVQPYQVEAKERYQLNGILTLEELTLFQYCMRSKNVMATIGGSWLPVIIQDTSLEVEEDVISKVFVVSFNVELAQVLRC